MSKFIKFKQGNTTYLIRKDDIASVRAWTDYNGDWQVNICMNDDHNYALTLQNENEVNKVLDEISALGE